MRNKFIVAFQSAALIGAQMLDYITTTVGIKLGATEQNPLVATVLKHWGNFGMFSLKLFMGIVFAIATKDKPLYAWIITIMTCGVALWNLRVINALVQ